LLALVSRVGARWALAALLTMAYAVFVNYLPWLTTGSIRYDHTGVRLLLGGLLPGSPALEGAARSPRAGMSPRGLGGLWVGGSLHPGRLAIGSGPRARAVGRSMEGAGVGGAVVL
jgi:hypothetical protein